MPQEFKFCKKCGKWHLYTIYVDRCGKTRKKILISDFKKLLRGHKHSFICDKDNDTFVHTEKVTDGDFVHLNATKGTLVTTDPNIKITGAGTKKLYHSSKGSLHVGTLTTLASDYWDVENVGQNSLHVGQNIRTTTDSNGCLVCGFSEGNSITNSGTGCGIIGNSDATSDIEIKTGIKGSYITGNATSGGTITIDGSGSGSSISGNTTGGKITIDGSGSSITGYTNGGGKITNSGAGCGIVGYTDSTSEIEIKGVLGSSISGAATGGGTIIIDENLTAGSFISAWSGPKSTVFTKQSGTTVLGLASTSSELSSVAAGGLAGGLALFSGSKISSNGQGSIAWGQNIIPGQITKTSAGGCFAFGQNVENDQTYSLIIGKNGKSLSGSSTPGTMPNPVPHTILGSGSIQIAGGINSASKTTVGQGISVIIGTQALADNPIGGGIADFWATTGADYAEYFEWNDGNKNNEDRDGYFVTLKGDKIVKASNSDQVIGLTVGKFANSGIIGDIAELHWNKSNKTDSLGRLQFKISHKKPLYDYIFSKTKSPEFYIHPEIKKFLDEKDGQDLINSLKSSKNLSDEVKAGLEKVTPIRIAIQNPDYKSTETYIPRSSRQEWQVVALLGKVYIRDNGQCKVGQKCDCLGGVAIPGNKWFVMERSSPNTVRIFFK